MRQFYLGSKHVGIESVDEMIAVCFIMLYLYYTNYKLYLHWTDTSALNNDLWKKASRSLLLFLVLITLPASVAWSILNTNVTTTHNLRPFIDNWKHSFACSFFFSFLVPISIFSYWQIWCFCKEFVVLLDCTPNTALLPFTCIVSHSMAPSVYTKECWDFNGPAFAMATKWAICSNSAS